MRELCSNSRKKLQGRIAASFATVPDYPCQSRTEAHTSSKDEEHIHSSHFSDMRRSGEACCNDHKQEHGDENTSLATRHKDLKKITGTLRISRTSREFLAERGGFEPPVQLLTVQRFSKPPPSATRPPLRRAELKFITRKLQASIASAEWFRSPYMENPLTRSPFSPGSRAPEPRWPAPHDFDRSPWLDIEPCRPLESPDRLRASVYWALLLQC